MSRALAQATAASAIALLYALPAHAQVIERNLPPQPAPNSAAIAPPSTVPADHDASPIGPAVTGIILLGAQDAVVAGAGTTGIDSRRVARINTAAGRAVLARYLKRPLSRQLIAEIEAAIARHYRKEGYPFVALSTPEQEVTNGILQIRVVEFQAGTVTVTGANRGSGEQVLEQVRQAEGAPIDVARLSEDLDWLNRNPFRQVQALFAPGDTLGRSNLTLAMAEAKPWRVYGGVNNNGSEATGRMRLFSGFQLAPLKGSPDTIVAYQFTGSDDLFDSGPAAYRSHAVTASLGLAPRHAIEVTVDRVDTYQSSSPFAVRQRTDGAILGLRLGAGEIGDLRVGVEARRGRRTILFGATPLITDEASVVQAYFGIEKGGVDRLGSYNVAVTLHVSPGGIGSDNSSGALAIYSAGRVTDGRYSYFDARYSRSTRLGGGLSLGTEVIGRFASGPLPETERVGIGGAGLVRGYRLDDGAFDDAIVMRTTLRTRPIICNAQGISNALQPYVFADAGYGRERRTHASATPVSAGAGASYRLDRYAMFQVDVARTLNATFHTPTATWRAQTSATLSF